MTVIDEYVATLVGQEKIVIRHMYGVVREMIPDATEELSYNMPTVKYKDKGVVAIIANKDFMSLYPFCNHESLNLDTRDFETTKGSIHFTLDHLIPDDFLREIITARLQQIG